VCDIRGDVRGKGVRCGALTGLVVVEDIDGGPVL
jgi:hypothetical protein